MRRVVVTGLGALCSIGRSTAEVLDALQTGRSGLGPLTHVSAEWYHTQVAATVPDVSFDHLLEPAEQKRVDRLALLALHAAEQAVRQAGFSAEAAPYRCGIVMGTGMGPGNTWEESFTEAIVDQRKPRPTTVPKAMYNAPAGHLSIRYNLRGPSLTTVTACSSSANAIGQSAALIRAGVADAMLAGGVETLPARAMFAAWDTLRVMSRDNDRPASSCRPFNRDRSGFVMGEGAAVLVLEAEERARARGAEILAEVAGCGLSSDAHHLTQPQVDGFEAALRLALDDAGLNPTDVQYINAHGTGTPTNDPMESAAIRTIFGDHARHLPVSSTKSAHGHTIGAAGALEAVTTILGLQHGFLPATLHLTDPDPACDLQHVALEPRAASFDIALSNSFAFGGHNVVLALRRYRG